MQSTAALGRQQSVTRTITSKAPVQMSSTVHCCGHGTKYPLRWRCVGHSSSIVYRRIAVARVRSGSRFVRAVFSVFGRPMVFLTSETDTAHELFEARVRAESIKA